MLPLILSLLLALATVFVICLLVLFVRRRVEPIKVWRETAADAVVGRRDANYRTGAAARPIRLDTTASATAVAERQLELWSQARYVWHRGG